MNARPGAGRASPAEPFGDGVLIRQELHSRINSDLFTSAVKMGATHGDKMWTGRRSAATRFGVRSSERTAEPADSRSHPAGSK